MNRSAEVKMQAPVGNPAFDVGFTEKVSNPVRCGVVGLGRIGWCHHCETIMKHGGFEMTAVCDLEEQRRGEARKATGCATYCRIEDLHDDKTVKLVVVATQSIDHEPMAIKAFKAGKHVLCEKPSAKTANGIIRMIAAARKSAHFSPRITTTVSTPSSSMSARSSRAASSAACSGSSGATKASTAGTTGRRCGNTGAA